MNWGSLRSSHPRALDGFDGAGTPGPAPRRDTKRSAVSRPVSDRRPAVEVVPSPADVDALLLAYLAPEDEPPPDTDRGEDLEGALAEVRRG